MADVSKIKLPNGTIYNIKDTVSGYITEAAIPSNVSVFNNDAGYVVVSASNHTLFLSPSIENGDGVGY